MSLTSDHRLLLNHLTALMRSHGRMTQSRSKYFRAMFRDVGEWGWVDNVVGLAIGWKTAARTPCLSIFVKRRYNRARLSASQFVPEGFQLPGGNAAVVTDVVETQDYARLHTPFSGTLRSGVSLGHEHGVLCPGSAGVLLERTAGDNKGVYLLGCAHVLALSGLAFEEPAAGQLIEQPFDPSSDPVNNQVAKLTTHFSPLTTRRNQTDDFAIARLLPGVSWDRRLKGSGRALTGLSGKSSFSDFSFGDAYVHHGAVTGPQLGFVAHATGSFKIRSSGHALESDWIYEGLIPYNAFGIEGDSGGAVTEKDGTDLVGLHIGGFSNGSMSFFFPIGPTLATLGFRPVQNRQSPTL